MYSRIINIHYRKILGHVFAKHVQIEGKIQFFFSSSQLFFNRSSYFCRQAMRVYVVRKWPLRERSRFVCWNITRVSLWLLSNAHFVQSTQRTRLRDLDDLKAEIIAAVKNIDVPMLTHVCQDLEYLIDVCRVTRGAHIELLLLTYSMEQSPS